MRRRELLMGSACLASAGAAFALTPRHRLSRLGDARLDQITPRRIGEWSSRDVAGLAPPSTADSLVAELYDELVERVYRHASTGAEIMMLLAHGVSQTNDLQLHRPEACYPAFGFKLSHNQSRALSIATGVLLPARRLVASGPGQSECVVYWTRIGDFLPTSGGAERMARLQSAMRGFVCDGVLARFSMEDHDTERAFALLERFIPDFLEAVSASARPAFIGSPLAELMPGNGSH
jgi:EpsI family protein